MIDSLFFSLLRFCIRCPKRAPFTASSGTVNRIDCHTQPTSSLYSTSSSSSSSSSLSLPEPEATEEFEQVSLLEVNDCFSLPCLNGGQCQALELGYVCRCPPGFTGSSLLSSVQSRRNQLIDESIGYAGMQCESDLDECDSAPCLNGATCTDRVNSFHCQCPPGFIGSQCQTDIDDCVSGPCDKGATCIDLPGKSLS